MALFKRLNFPHLVGDKMTLDQYKKLADEKEALFRQLFTPIIKLLKELVKFYNFFLPRLIFHYLTR